jgi:septal ring factor EnvC (AmiA/AmiB activator)
MRTGLLLLVPLLLVVAACGVPQEKYDAAVKDASDARAELQKGSASQQEEQKRIQDLEGDVKKLREELALAESKATTDEDKARLEELKKAEAEAEERAKLMTDLVDKFKQMVDAGALKIIVRHGRLV